MRRALMLLVSFSLVCVLGCGNRYERRTVDTLDKMRYAKRLDDNLQPAPSDGKLKEIAIYVRAPIGMERAKTFTLTQLPPGKFDAEESFVEQGKSSLHILARQKTAKKAPAKKDESAPEPAPRGEFTADVREILGAYFNDSDALAPEKAKESKQKGNTFRRTTFKANNKNVEVYIHKADPYDTALIFIVDPADAAALATKIQLCLESFRVGSKAKALYDNGGAEEESTDAGVSTF